MEEGGRSWELGRKVGSLYSLPDGQNGPAISNLMPEEVAPASLSISGPISLQTQGGGFFSLVEIVSGSSQHSRAAPCLGGPTVPT